MTHSEALQAVAADMYTALQAWRAADSAQADCDTWPLDDSDDEYDVVEIRALDAWRNARSLTVDVNHRIQALCADSVTPVTFEIGEDA